MRSLVLKAMQLPEYHPYLLDALKNEKKKSTLADRWAGGWAGGAGGWEGLRAGRDSGGRVGAAGEQAGALREDKCCCRARARVPPSDACVQPALSARPDCCFAAAGRMLLWLTGWR